MVTDTKILVILNIVIPFALGDSAIDHYSDPLSNSINNANNNYNHVTGHAETNQIRQNTNHNLNKLQQLRSAMRDLPYKFKDQTPNLINFLHKPGVARALFFASSAVSCLSISLQRPKRYYLKKCHRGSQSDGSAILELC